MHADSLQIYLGVAGLLLAGIGVPLLVMQLRDLKRGILFLRTATVPSETALTRPVRGVDLA